MSNLLHFEFYPGRKLQHGDLVHYTKYKGEGTRQTQGYMTIITKIKSCRLEVFDVTEKRRYKITMSECYEFEESRDDMQKTSLNMQNLLQAAKLNRMGDAAGD